MIDDKLNEILRRTDLEKIKELEQENAWLQDEVERLKNIVRQQTEALQKCHDLANSVDGDAFNRLDELGPVIELGEGV